MAEPAPPTVPSPQIPAVPELVASTPAPVTLRSGETRIRLEIHAPRGPALHRDPATFSVFLRLENVTTDGAAPNCSVYAGMPEGQDPLQHPELYVGTMDSFGLAEASMPDGKHGGSGRTYSLNITRLFHSLRERGLWHPRELVISIVAYSEVALPKISVGKVSLYLQ